MSVGARIREERLRLGHSQVHFAGIAGASKNTEINWEKDSSSPTVDALIAWAEAGADALYIISGIRQSEPFSRRADANTQAKIDQLEDVLSNPSRQQYELQMTYDEVREGARLALEKIATSSSPDVSDAARARADDAIRAQFPNDKGASKRRSARFASMMLSRQTVDRNLEDVLKGIDVDLPRNLHHQLLQLTIDYQISTADLIPLLSEIAKPYQADKSGQWMHHN